MAAFLNDGMAQLTGIGVAGVAFLLLAGRPAAHQQELVQRLRHELARATEGSLRRLPHSFESRSRDLMRRIATLPEPARSTLTLGALSVLELGDATVDLRRTLRTLRNASLLQNLEKLLSLLACSYRQADRDSRRAALRALQQDLHTLSLLLEKESQDELLALQRQLYRIYSVLNDDDWFSAFSQQPAEARLEVRHAS